MATTSHILSLLLLALTTTTLHARRLSNSLLQDNEIDNDIQSGSGGAATEDADRPGRKHVDWVRISLSPAPILRHTEGSHFELECEAVGSPAPVMHWIKDGKPLLSDADEFETNLVDEREQQGLAKARARLVIRALLDGNAGVYTCVAESGRQVATASTQLHVKGTLQGMNLSQVSYIAKHTPARIVLYDTVFMNNIGEDVILPCAAVGSPQPDIIWLDPNDQTVLEDDKRITLLPNGALLIRSIRWNDMGPYTCVARNSHGQDNITTFLYPMLAEK